MYTREQLKNISHLRGRLLNDIVNELKWEENAQLDLVDTICLLYVELGKVLRENI